MAAHGAVRLEAGALSLPKNRRALCPPDQPIGVALCRDTVDKCLIPVLLSGDMQATQTLVLQRPAAALNGLLPAELLLLISSQCGCGMRN